MILQPSLLNEMWEGFRNLGKRALSLSHYELAEQIPGLTPDAWKSFLMLPEVDEWVRTEHNLLQETELRKLLSNVSNSNSMGRAQLINSLTKIQESGGAKDGPIFIYTYVPLDDQQQHAPHVRSEDRDIFQL